MVYGADALGASMEHTCEMARYLERRIGETPELELAAPVELNIVCFRYRAPETDHGDQVNARIAVELQESGVAAPSTTVLGGKLAIRAAIVNHRTGRGDVDLLVERTVILGRSLCDRAPRLAREAALREIEARVAADPGAVDPQLERARLFAEMGRTREAREAYLRVLAIAPSDRTALNDLGTLLHSTGYRTAARTAYAEAAARRPGDTMSHVNLANALYENGEAERAREHYEAALQCAPDCAEAHQGLSYVLAETGDAAGAALHRRKGWEHHAVLTLPYRGEGPPVPLLLLISTVGGNIPVRHLLDDRVFETTVIAPEFCDSGQALPRHRVIFNSIGDADLAGDALAAAQSLAALSGAPLLNSPASVMATGRADNARRLSRLPGVIAAATVTLARELLSAPEASTTLARHGLQFPLLLRAPGFHTGRHFVKAERAGGLREAVAGLPGAELTAIQYLDARGADGKARKYRVMMIDGRLYPLHLAISSHWKIHYFTAEMADSAEHRAEDAEFLGNMERVLGPRAMGALEQIQQVLALDYAGIDFGLSAAGDLLLFEANATMVVNPPEPDERWAYRRPAVDRIFAAVRAMLLTRAGAM
jgi:Flp pilus assembly protein TadD